MSPSLESKSQGAATTKHTSILCRYWWGGKPNRVVLS